MVSNIKKFSFLVFFLSFCSFYGVVGHELSAAETAHWSYEGDHGPAHWGGLDTAYKACDSGTSQSPIDITGATAESLTDITFNYDPNLGIINNGHAVQIDPTRTIVVDDTTYTLLQYHFHSPSEHTVNGKQYDAEAHFVHKDSSGNLAVVGVLIEKGKNNSQYTKMWSKFSKIKNSGDETSISFEKDMTSLLPHGRKTYRYEGSLTTPPCTEGVKWLVMVEPIQMSDKQIKQLQAIHKDNFRPVQALHGRTIKEDND